MSINAIIVVVGVLSSSIGLVSSQGVAGDLSPLGTDGMAGPWNYTYDVTVNDDCEYSASIDFIHDWDLPFGGNTTCLPGVDAMDGLPYQEGRWYYERFPKYVRDATGIDHPSIDWNPCGHPGPGFLVPHTDIHFYTVSPQYRLENMTCVLIPGTPVCDSEWQDDANGWGYFDFPTYVPSDLVFFVQDAVVHMGTHGFAPSTVPATPAEWKVPTLVMVSHAAKVIGFEPMMSHEWTSGPVDKFYEEEVVYSDPAEAGTLPNYYSVQYTASTGIARVTLKGNSAICKEQFDELKANYDPLTDPELVGESEQNKSGSSRDLKMTTVGKFAVLLVTSVVSVYVGL